jgi:7-cyano-7-deazaguanine synthase in queuosine biosynthesis
MSKSRILDHVSGHDLELEIGQNVSVNVDPFAGFGNLDSLDHDLLNVASCIYASDLAIKRKEREQHLRSMTLRVPVVNVQAFERVRPLLERALTTLSIDNWTLEFFPAAGSVADSTPEWPAKENSTLMFSGGLDSFAGSFHLLNSEQKITLVSHVTHNRPVETSQSRLADAVRSFTGKDVLHLQVRIFGRNHGKFTFPTDSEREETQRTRSFLYSSLAAVAARLSRSRRIIVMAENGQFAIHLPLSEARVGSFSTHTAHPKFLREMQDLLRALYLCEDLEVVNPFVHRTKAEVVALIPKACHSHIKDSTSCWRASRVKDSFTHCGECVPCLTRRIALESNGITLPEYERDLLAESIGSLKSDDLGKRNLIDVCQFVGLFGGPNKIASNEEISYQFPELFDPHVDAAAAISMYQRFATEALKVFKGYPGVKSLLK